MPDRSIWGDMGIFWVELHHGPRTLTARCNRIGLISADDEVDRVFFREHLRTPLDFERASSKTILQRSSKIGAMDARAQDPINTVFKAFERQLYN